VKRLKTIQLKAIFLLIVFSFNTIIGFACAIGLNMGFNSKHHHHDETISHNTKSHHHNGKSHHHHKGTESHTNISQHHNNEINKSGATEKENCCSEDATQLSQSDKLLVNVANSGIEMPVALIALHFLYISHLSSFKTEITKIQEVRPYVLNSRGIRVSIQSFQI
jgi:hypothetical protein